MRRQAIVLGIFGLMGSSPIRSLAGQEATAPIAQPIRVALVLRGEGELDGTSVIRRAHRGPKNLMLLGRGANAGDLAATLSLMSALRVEFGDAIRNDVRARVGSFRLPPDWEGSAYSAWLQEQFARLRASAPRRLGSLGTGRMVQVTLPAPAGRFVKSNGLRG